MFEALKKYADFKGRARRKEYWLFILLYSICYFIAFLIDVASGALIIFTTIVALGLLIPLISVAVRRLHDTDRSGWWFLLGFVPFANIVLLIFSFWTVPQAKIGLDLILRDGNRKKTK